jgi:hypothetical protein
LSLGGYRVEEGGGVGAEGTKWTPKAIISPKRSGRWLGSETSK